MRHRLPLASLLSRFTETLSVLRHPRPAGRKSEIRNPQSAILLTLLALTTACRAQAPKPEAQIHMVPMRDGVKLATAVLVPQGKGPWPVLLSRTPYNKDKGLAGGGPVVRVVQDMRGRFASEGQALPFFQDAWGEMQDGYDTIEWIAKQPWCNGKVGMTGGSAGGIVQYMAAGTAPAALKCCAAVVAAPSLYHHAFFPGGAFRKSDLEKWWSSNSLPPEALRQVLSHREYDDFWRSVDLIARAPRVRTPMIHSGGWYDMFSQGTLDAFTALQHHGGEGARGQQVLVIGPWVHSMRPGGELQFPASAGQNPAQASQLQWMAHWLLDRPTPLPDRLPVNYYVMGACGEEGAPGNEWRTAADWPVPATATPLYLHQGGRASFAAPDAAEASPAYRYDPRNPVPSRGGGNLTLPAGPMDQRPVETRDDVLLFTTDPLDKPLEITGRVAARLFVSSDCPDTDFTAKLTDVYPDGRSMLLCDGILRMRYRDGFERAKRMEPGKVYEAKVDLWSTSIIVNKGHRIRVAVSSSNAPRFEPNPNTGGAFDGTREPRVARNTLHLEMARPSQVVLPVVAGGQ